ncbi:Alpha/Beta hydrolase protein [Dipodascopsis tothii]|uniref:Alpha/Beta hydrolase protein n=1 Tax=Dipodascopsis tothii TaxID=44089 RepID=UPI0034CF13DE
MDIHTTDRFVTSGHDGIPLETTVYARKDSLRTVKAVVSHPYAALGGSKNDPVVKFCARKMAALGIESWTYNYRGATEFYSGHTSWTGAAEQADLRSIVEAVVAGEPALRRLIVVGYSYGALVSAAVVQAERGPEPRHNARTGAARPGLDERERAVDVAYVLISPPLFPVSFFIQLGLGRREPEIALTRGFVGDRIVARNRRLLVVVGDQDEFTSAAKYDRWEAAHRRHAVWADGRSSALAVVHVASGRHAWDYDELTAVWDGHMRAFSL